VFSLAFNVGRWQFPPGVKQPEGFLLRSELRKLRLERNEKTKMSTEDQKDKNISQVN